VTSPPAAARQGRLSSVAGPAPSRGQSGRSDTPRSQAQADVWRCGWIGRSGRCVTAGSRWAGLFPGSAW